MNILIDGYNLLHGAGIVVETSGPYSLEKSRQALLKFLIATLDQRDLENTTVVFDARNAPPGLPRSYSQSGITILFADRNEDADTLIARLVQHSSAPKKLLVVSSDHYVQRAARRRKAQFCDSDRWFASMVRQRQSNPPLAMEEEKPAAPLGAQEVADWLTRFAVELEPPDEPETRSANREEQDKDEPDKDEPDFNPFPPGYAEDLLDDDSR
jgi:predicted RNA-binding protein with PIN domain